jgi:hypothetical protein
MCYLVNVDHNGMPFNSPGVTVEGFRKCCVSSAVGGTDDDNDMLWNSSEGDGNVRSECVEEEGIDCEDGDGDTDW